MISTKRRPYWDRDVIKEAKRYGALEGSKIQRIYLNYVALMRNLVDEEPTCFEEERMDGGRDRRIPVNNKE